jgi:hypothetical protein
MHPFKLGVFVVTPIVIAMALVDNGSKPGSSGPESTNGQTSSFTDEDYAQCLSAKASAGPFSSHDGGEGAIMLTTQCDGQWRAWIDRCKARGTDDGICSATSVAMAQTALKLAGK